MNWDIFNAIGYLSVLLWVGVLLLWLTHWKLKRRSLCRLALVLALAAFVCAMINSVMHVNRIQLDRSAQMAEWEARQEASRQAALDSRGDEVAQIRFAEDAAGEFMDKAGMDEADLKYMAKLEEPSVPEWRKAKKTRAGDGAPDDSLEGLIGDGEKTEGIESDLLEESEESSPILMKEADMVMAHRLDRWNLKLTRILILLAVLVLVIDYLRRANIYKQATTPLPLPSAWITSLTAMPPVVVRPEPPRRTVPKELAWLIKRGDSFVYLTDDPAAAAGIPASLPRLAMVLRREEVVQVTEGDDGLSDDFVFEALWFGRASFVVDSSGRAERMLTRFLELLEERKTTRARVTQTVHIVWDLKEPMPEAILEPLTQLAQDSGFSLFIVS